MKNRKKLLMVFTLTGLLAISLIGCGVSDSFQEEVNDALPEDLSSEETYDNEALSEAVEPETPNDTEADKTESIEETSDILPSGSYTLQSGMELSYTNYVRNDTTGNWRIALTASGANVADYAMEYYEEMFSNDDEIHGIVNFTLNTTTCIKVMSGCLFVDTYEYVDKEEHDANLLFSGDSLDSKIFNIESGEEM